MVLGKYHRGMQPSLFEESGGSHSKFSLPGGEEALFAGCAQMPFEILLTK
jgi:hypothetical protein